MFQTIMLFLLYKVCKGTGMVRPFSAKFVTMSVTSAIQPAEYNFTMTFDNPVPVGGTVEITFPSNQYTTGLGLSSSPTAYFPYPNAVSIGISDRTIIYPVTTALLADMPYVFTILGINNPSKVGGTSNFGVLTRYTSGGYVIDESTIFGVIGVSPVTAPLLNNSIQFETGKSSAAGEFSNYIITMMPSVDVPSNVIFRFTFDTRFNFQSLLPSQCAVLTVNNFVPKGNFTCTPNQNFNNIIEFSGNSAFIPKETLLQFKISNVQNLQRKITSNLMTYEIREKGTNNTLQISDSVTGLVFNAGAITNINLTLYMANQLPFAGMTRTFSLIFKPMNPFISIFIFTDFSLILSCQIVKGLLDIDQFSDIVCTPQSNVMFISNFAQYKRSEFANDYVQLQFTATTSSSIVKTNAIQITTYFDLGRTQTVDQSLNDENSRIQLIATR